MFWILVTLFCLAALGFVLIPLVRDPAATRARHALSALDQLRAAGLIDEPEHAAKRQVLLAASPAGARKQPWLPAGLLAVLIPFGATALYFHLGNPAALDVAAQPAVAGPSGGAAADGAAPPDMEQAVAGLAERLRNEPDNLDGWLLLGRAYKQMARFAPASEALANAYRLAPQDADVLVEYAEAMALASPTRRIEGQALEMIVQALKTQPEHQRGLWLRGVAAMQAEEPGVALTHWQALRKLLAADPAAVASLDEQIAGARQAAGLPDAHGTAQPEAPATAEADPATEGDKPSLTVTVDLAAELASQVGPSDVLFVFARAATGSKMPLAIQRLPAGGFPRTVVLDDSQSMMAGLTLSSQTEVVIGARISKSGQAIPQSGDFEALSDPVATKTREPIALTIRNVVP